MTRSESNESENPVRALCLELAERMEFPPIGVGDRAHCETVCPGREAWAKFCFNSEEKDVEAVYRILLSLE